MPPCRPLASTGVVSATQLYAPYGAVRYQSGALPTSYGYTHQRSDAVSGLDYYGARYYDPLAGQFTSADTTLAGGLNRYAYVGGNPETRTDPSGRMPVSFRDYNSQWAYSQWLDQPHTYYGSVGAFVRDSAQFFLGTDTLSQSYHTLFQDPHASAGDKLKAAGVGVLTLGTDLLTIGSTLAGDPEVGAAARAGDEALLAAEEAEHAAAVAANATTDAATAAVTAGDGYVDFAHGTSPEYAQSIIDGGLNADAARTASKGGRYSAPGSYFTFNATKYGRQALQDAHDMALATTDRPVVLIGRLPRSVYDELMAEGAVRVSPIPGVDSLETVFSPGAFARLNESMEWLDLIDPYKGSR